MKVSTRGRYGLKAMVDIATCVDGDKCISLKSIADRQGLSENYLEQIIAPIKKAGLVKSVRGSQGGYLLTKPAEEITVGDVLRILEGSLAPADCVVNGEGTCGSSNCGTCATKSVWSKIFNSLNDVVDSISIADLVNDCKSSNTELPE